MNIIFVCQGSILEIFFRCAKFLINPLKLEKIGFYVSNSLYFKKFSNRYPEILSNNYKLLKEWDITYFKKVDFNIDRINTYEKEIGNPFLWGPLVGDRRIFQGKLCKVHQDYTPRYSYEEMLTILDRALCHIDKFVKNLKPDVIISFVPATFGEYIFYLFAQARKIPFLQLKTIKIKNYVTLSTSIFEKPEHIYKRFENYQKNSQEDEWIKETHNFLKEARKGNIKYEGVIVKKKNKPNFLKEQKRLPVHILTTLQFLFSLSKDPHIPGILIPMLYKKIINPINRKLTERMYFAKEITEENLKKIKYVFYPMHTEPEIALSIYGKAYQNQIEVIRNIAQNIPVGMRLIIKEHPRSAGMRKFSYYKQLKQIPNVILLSPSIKTDILIKNAELIIVISGSIGFESAIMKKPVITLGLTPYNILPEYMVRKVKDMNKLDEEIKNTIKKYKYDETSMVNYVASVIRESVQLDLYSLILEKKNRYSFSPITESEKEKQIKRCAEYMKKRIEKELKK